MLARFRARGRMLARLRARGRDDIDGGGGARWQRRCRQLGLTTPADPVILS
jgi:hypothetical protein